MVSENNRNIVLKENPSEAFEFISETGWNIVQQLSREEIIEYLDIRAQQGFTVLKFIATGHDFRAQKHYGWRPVQDDDFSNPTVEPGPNNDWWDYIEWIISELEKRNMYAGLLPTWREDFRSKRIAGEDECEAYGRFLGERFRAHNDRIIWLLGGDLPTAEFHLSWHRALARGIAKGVSKGKEDYNAIFCSYHPAGRGDTLAFPENEPFMDFNAIQSGHWNSKPHELQSQGMIRKCLNKQNKPCLELEPMYEEIAVYASAPVVRRIIWWNIFEGGFGTAYGHGGVWHFGTYNHKGDGWIWNHPQDYKDVVAKQMIHLRYLLDSRPGIKRIADLDPIDPNTRYADHQRIYCIRDEDRTYLMVYTPQGRNFSIRMDRLSAQHYHVWWYNPRTGEAISGSKKKNPKTTITFDPPGQQGELYADTDWVLVLDDAAKQYPPPGK